MLEQAVNLADVLGLVAADGRRRLTDEETSATLRLWAETFSSTKTEDLRAAVMTWLEEHPRGRPNVGELKEILKRSQNTHVAQRSGVWEEEKAFELRWAVSILEQPERYQNPNYQHTIESAEFSVRKFGYSTWQQAKAWLEPGWAPATVSEVYL